MEDAIWSLYYYHHRIVYFPLSIVKLVDNPFIEVLEEMPSVEGDSIVVSVKHRAMYERYCHRMRMRYDDDDHDAMSMGKGMSIGQRRWYSSSNNNNNNNNSNNGDDHSYRSDKTRNGDKIIRSYDDRRGGGRGGRSKVTSSGNDAKKRGDLNSSRVTDQVSIDVIDKHNEDRPIVKDIDDVNVKVGHSNHSARDNYRSNNHNKSV